MLLREIDRFYWIKVLKYFVVYKIILYFKKKYKENFSEYCRKFLGFYVGGKFLVNKNGIILFFCRIEFFKLLVLRRENGIFIYSFLGVGFY